MAFTVTNFIDTWPYFYHLTFASNLRSIRETGRLDSASALAVKAGRSDLLRCRRSKHVPIMVGGVEIRLRDQAPLHAANVGFEEGWTLEDLVELLNGFVFFWLGTPRVRIDPVVITINTIVPKVHP